MYFGYLSLQSYTFLAIGFVLVMVVAVGLVAVYAVGASRGAKAARMWLNVCVAVLVIGGVADVIFAVVSHQWESFMVTYGSGPIAEMSMLAVLLVGSLWFMAVRYTQGLES